jgi:hypothetical protein
MSGRASFSHKAKGRKQENGAAANCLTKSRGLTDSGSSAIRSPRGGTQKAEGKITTKYVCMRKRGASTSVCSGLAILAGSLTFMGSAQTVTLLNEGFEGVSNVFSAGTYNYAQNYTMPNLLTPGGGLTYMKGGNGINGAASTNLFSAGSLSLLSGGITSGQIDSGSISYTLYSQFSTYLFQGDYATLRVQFLDAGSSPIGSLFSVGGATFTAALGSGNNGTYTDARNWGADSLAGIVPTGARFAAVSIEAVKVPSGLAIDGYVDNVNISISVVPEPSVAGLVGLGGGLLTLARRRRRT